MSDQMIRLINLYRTSHPLAGFSILQQVEKLMPSDCDVIKGDNCVTFRQLVSEMLFGKEV